MKNLYIHVPFCKSKCRYCDFYSVVASGKIVKDYIGAVERELGCHSAGFDAVDTVYIGGGTPTVLDIVDLELLLRAIRSTVDISDHAEFTIEANPGTLNDKNIAMMKSYGVNRISIGIQSLDDRFLSSLSRGHNAEQAEEAMSLIRDNFSNYSVDIIYGIPGQEAMDLVDTIKRVLEYYPPHISAYELTPEKGTPLFEDIKSKKIYMPDEDNILELYRACADLLAREGYSHYEISSYARPGYVSRHNMNYWKRGQYIGIGPSAHSFAGKKRYSNVKDVRSYCSKISEGISPVEEVTILSSEDDLREKIMLGLRTSEGIDPREVSRTVSGDKLMDRIAPLIEGGLMRMDGPVLSITEKGFPLSNSLIIETMRHLGL